MGRLSQPALFEHEFRTARPARPVYCHQEFLDKLAARRNEPVGKRAALVLQRMAVDISRLHYKGTSGLNRGWRRSRLGGSSGSHFYCAYRKLHRCSKYVNSCVFLAAPTVSSPMLQMQFS